MKRTLSVIQTSQPATQQSEDSNAQQQIQAASPKRMRVSNRIFHGSDDEEAAGLQQQLAQNVSCLQLRCCSCRQQKGVFQLNHTGASVFGWDLAGSPAHTTYALWWQSSPLAQSHCAVQGRKLQWRGWCGSCCKRRIGAAHCKACPRSVLNR